MKYKLDGNSILFALNRPEIIDISPNDVLEVEGFPGARYVWTDHDTDFMENNPDDEMYLQIERRGPAHFEAKGVILKVKA